MKRTAAFILAFIFLIMLCSCKPEGATDTPELPEISGYTQEQLEEKLIGLSIDEIHHSWGEPDGHLSGFWGEIWSLDGGKENIIVLYYDENGMVEYINRPFD